MNVPHYGGIGSFYPYYLQAKDGVAYIGLYYYRSTEDYREYAQVELLDSLKKDVCYYVEFYAANSQGPPYAANNVAANLSAICYNTTTLTTNNSILGIPSHITNYGNPILPDTVKWHKISGIYEALGIEKYLVIGNFASNAQTDTVRIFRPVGFANFAYMHIDAVSVYSINPSGSLPWTYRDTIINKGDSVFIGNKMGGLNFHPQWFHENGTYIKTNAGITVSPTLTTNYVVQYTLCGVRRIDTVKVTVPLENDVAVEKFQLLNEGLEVYPVPAQDFLELKISKAELFKDFTSVSIYNNLGQLIREEEISFKDKTLKIKTDDLQEGVYSLLIRSKKSEVINKRFVISR